MNKPEIVFSKMSGTGNDFIVIDNTQRIYDLDWSAFAKRHCERRVSVGADGVLVLEPHATCDFNYRIFNADGSEAEMCGNGARCAARFAFEHGIAAKEMRFMTLAGVIEAHIEAEDVAVKMTKPKNMRLDIAIELNSQPVTVHFADTGVPHAIVFVDNIDEYDVETNGRALRYHSEFAPAGTNADFVGVTGPDSIKVRTYERGVEGETLACGTGAVASALLTHASGRIKTQPIKVAMPGGQLKIDFNKDGDAYTAAWLIGKVDTVYTAKLV